MNQSLNSHRPTTHRQAPNHLENHPNKHLKTHSTTHSTTYQVAVSDLLNVNADRQAFAPSFFDKASEPNLANNPLFAQPRVINALTLMARLHAHNCQSFGLSNGKNAKKPTQTYAHTLLLGTHGMGKTAFIKAWLHTHANDCTPLPLVVFVDTHSPFDIYHLPVTSDTHSLLEQNLAKFWQVLAAYVSQDDPAHQSSLDDAVLTHLQNLAKLLPMPSWQGFINTLIKTLRHSIKNSPLMFNVEQIKQRFFIYLSPSSHLLPPISIAQPATLLDVLGGVTVPAISQHTNNPADMNAVHLLDLPNMLHSAYWHIGKLHIGKLMTAHGGYLLIRLADLLAQPALRQRLYDVLTTGYLPIGYYTATQQPLTYPANTPALPVTVTLIGLGEADEFDKLCDSDPSFARLFAVRAQFDDTVAQTPANQRGFAELVYQRLNDLCHQSHQHTPHDAQSTPISPDATDAIWQLYRHFIRLSEHNRLLVHLDKLHHLIQASWVSHNNPVNNPVDNQAKLSTPIQTGNVTKDITKAGHVIEACDVIEAINGQALQADYLKSLYWQDIVQGQQYLTTQGWQTGRINALTVIDHADTQFGMPIQLTAVIEPRIGHGDIIDIEREVELGGDLHAKGMLIMSHFLKSTFSPFCPLHFSASLAVEQNYGEIDGDSATLAQGCALLSALGQVDIYQGIAVTGSMNQLGDVQAVGGINEKIESFFELCQLQDDKVNSEQNSIQASIQGVIIPKANITDLVLDERVIQAVSAGQFAIYAVSHIGDAMTLLTQMPYSNKTKKGSLSKHCLQGRIIKRLKQWGEDENT